MEEVWKELVVGYVRIKRVCKKGHTRIQKDRGQKNTKGYYIRIEGVRKDLVVGYLRMVGLCKELVVGYTKIGVWKKLVAGYTRIGLCKELVERQTKIEGVCKELANLSTASSNKPKNTQSYKKENTKEERIST